MNISSAKRWKYSHCPRVWRYISLGKATLTHDPQQGFLLEGTYRGAEHRIHRKSAQTNSLHVEYDFGLLKKKDYVDISTKKIPFTAESPPPA